MKVREEWERLHPYPRGWYAIDTAYDLKAGELRHRQFMGEQVVYFRTHSGQLVMLDAYCAHMGAHLGHGGRVNGETVVCPFHGFAFGADGKLVSAPDLARCPRLEQKSYLVEEKWGYVMAWHDPEGGAPSWHVPPVVDLEGWTAPLTETRVLDVHPVDVAENAPDIRHFRYLHHNTFELKSYGELDENTFNVLYEGRIMDEHAGRDAYHRIAVGRIDIHLLGVGLLNARVLLPKLGLSFHYLVSPAPLDADRTQLLIGVSMKRTADIRGSLLDRVFPRLCGALPLPGIERLLPLWQADFLRGQLEDEPIWRHKRYLATPGFIDPPVRSYRRWAARFVKPLHARERPPASSAAASSDEPLSTI